MFFFIISETIRSENTIEYIKEGSYTTTDIKSFKLSNSYVDEVLCTSQKCKFLGI